MTRTWWDNEDILRQFRGWLTQTDDEIAALDDSTSDDDALWPVAADADNDDEDYADADNDDDADAAAAADADDSIDPQDEGEPLPDVGLLQVVEALTAMRHEWKLQTKSSRGLEEAVTSSRAALDAAIGQFQSVQAQEEQAAQRASLPLVEALVGLDEALARGAKALEITHRQMTRFGPQQLQAALDEQFRKLPWWRRRLAGSWHRQMRSTCADALSLTTGEEFAKLMEGYKLIETRVAQSLKRHGIDRIATSGRVVDPSMMTVVELVEDPQAEPETVVEEVRPGYIWQGHVIRFAEVRAVAGRAGSNGRLQKDSTNSEETADGPAAESGIHQ